MIKVFPLKQKIGIKLNKNIDYTDQIEYKNIDFDT